MRKTFPWGYFDVLYKTGDVIVELFLVRPGKKTDEGYRAEGDELWFVLKGKIERNGKTYKKKESFFIKAGQKYVLCNRFKENFKGILINIPK